VELFVCLSFGMARAYEEALHEEMQEPLLRDAVQEAEFVEKEASWFYRDFTDFLGRDNVLEVALGLIIGGAFTGVVTSLVSDIILPPISLITDSSKNLANYFFVLRPGETPDAIYNTVAQAAEDGAIFMAWGHFVQKSIDFVILGLVLYLMIKLIAMLGDDGIVKKTTDCEHCRKDISVKALRCPFCTSWQAHSNHPN